MKNSLLPRCCFHVFAAAVLAWGIPSDAFAGDPCPIGIELYEARPSWRDHAADLKALKTKRLALGLTSFDDDNGKITLSARPGSPAERAGVQDKDELVSINGQSSAGRTKNNRIFDQLLRNSPDAPVKLVVKRSGELMSLELLPERVDPIFWGILNAGEAIECRKVSLRSPTAEQQRQIEKALVDTQRNFLCADGHQNKALQKMFESGSLIMMRGGKRIMFVMPGWQTTCVNTGEYDGQRTSSDSAQGQKTWMQLLNRVSERYVKDRFKNP